MARRETDREDLMAEAKALRERVELAVPGEAEHVVAGFHADGRFSLYFGADPVFHFDPEGRLRRAFVGGLLYRSQQHTLARLTRTRGEDAVRLERHDLGPRELTEFLSGMQQRLQTLLAALEQNTARVVQQVPRTSDLTGRIIPMLHAALRGELSTDLRVRMNSGTVRNPGTGRRPQSDEEQTR